MSNVEILEQVGILGSVRERLGADNRYDTAMDSEIEDMNSKELVAEWCGWHLGTGGWADEAIDYYLQIEELKSEAPKQFCSGCKHFRPSGMIKTKICHEVRFATGHKYKGFSCNKWEKR